MHRMFSVPRHIGRGRLAFVLSLLVGIHAASAQDPTAGQDHPVIELAVGSLRSCQMTTKLDLKRVENANSNIVRVERVAGKNNEILLVAESPGRTIITFTDQKDRVEVHEVVVAAAPQPIQPAVAALPVVAAQPAVGGGPEAQQMTLGTKTFKTVRLREAPLGGIVNENSKVVRVNIAKDDLTVVTFEALEIGRTRVIFFYDQAKTRAEVYELTVVGPEQRGVHQVQLEVVIAIVNRSEARNMSFSWAMNGNNWYAASLFGGPFNFSNGIATGVMNSLNPVTGSNILSTSTPSSNIPFGIMNQNGNFMGFIQALKLEGLAKTLAEPRIVTLSGVPATINSGGKVPILTSSGVGAPSVSYEPFGTRVTFRPDVNADGQIDLKVFAEISNPDSTLGINIGGTNPTSVQGFRSRSADVKVKIESGQTLAIGGLIQTDINATISRVPFLGDLPFVGVAFTSKSYSESETELLILVTPRLVHPIDCTKLPKYFPGRETRSPDDFELFLEGIMEAPRGQRNVIFHPHLYKPAYHNAANAGEIPCGDGSCYRAGGPGCASGNCAPQHATVPTSGGLPRAEMPMPSFPEVPATPTSNPKVIVEPELPGALPPIREVPPSLGPVIPTLPPARQQVPSPVLPPLSVSPAGR